MPDTYDAAKHPRQPDHSEFIRRVTEAVNPKVQNEPPVHQPMPRRADKGQASHGLGAASPSGRGPSI